MARPLSNGIPPKAGAKVEPEPKTLVRSKTVAEPKEEKKEFGTLTLSTGGQLGKRYAIGEKGLIIGRDPAQCDIVIMDPNVSRVHAWVTVKKGEVVIIDRGSTNGTYVNQVKVEDANLKSGDSIQLGRKCNTTLVFNL
jgi:pSer/pThr/pTyr-binding forkhead associated (FHA) protein